MNNYSEILSNADIAGVFETPANAADDIVAAATELGHVVYRIDMRKAHACDEMLHMIGVGLDLPPWYGTSFDALNDCICDMGWAPGTGYTVILENCHNLNNTAHGELNMLLDVFNEAAASWREETPPKPFWCFIDLPSNV